MWDSAEDESLQSFISFLVAEDAADFEKSCYIEILEVNDELCKCKGCQEYREQDETFDKFCKGVQLMASYGIATIVFIVIAILAGSFAVLMPIYHSN